MKNIGWCLKNPLSTFRGKIIWSLKRHIEIKTVKTPITIFKESMYLMFTIRNHKHHIGNFGR